MIKETFLTLSFSIGMFASCTNKKFKQSLDYDQPLITLADNIDSIVVAKMNQYNIPGLSIGIIKNDSIFYAKGFGVASINSPKPVTENSIFHTASVSKIFTALAIMNLVENKQLSLDDKLTTVLPKLRFDDKRAGAITIRTLLNHTSGIADVNSYHWANNNQANNSLENYLLNEDFELEFGPSSKYKYCNLGYDILGYTIEKVSGLSFEDYVKKNILLPAAMIQSDFRFFEITDSLKTFPHSENWLSKEIYQRNTYPYTREHAPSSTLNSSAKELSQWMISFIDKLDTEKDPYLLHSMIGESTNTSKFIGLGFQLYSIGGKKAIGHYGGDIGFRSYLVMVPEEKIGLVLLANCDYHEEFRSEISHQILKTLRGN